MTRTRTLAEIIGPNGNISGGIPAAVRDCVIAELNRRNPAGEARMFRDRDDPERLNLAIALLRESR